MRELHLFAGAGGGILGGMLLGHRCVGAVEIDKYARAVLEARQRDGFLEPFPIHDDIRTFDGRAFIDGLATKWQDARMAGTPKKLTHEQAAHAAKLYETGLSCSELAELYGISRQAMWSRLKSMVTMRPKERYGADNHFYRGGTRSCDWVHGVTEKAILAGILVPQPCEVCGCTGTMSDGRNAVQAHHDNYNFPLQVRWLCQTHHHEWHKNNQPIRRMEAPGVDVVAGGFP